MLKKVHLIATFLFVDLSTEAPSAFARDTPTLQLLVNLNLATHQEHSACVPIYLWDQCNTFSVK